MPHSIITLLPTTTVAIPVWEKRLGRAINVEKPESNEVIIGSDHKLLYRLVDNLIRNVKNHTPDDSKCTISISSSGKHVVLAVSDDGPGLTEEIAMSLNREGSSSDHAGVGLNLCHRIAEISGIELNFCNAPSRTSNVSLSFVNTTTTGNVRRSSSNALTI